MKKANEEEIRHILKVDESHSKNFDRKFLDKLPFNHQELVNSKMRDIKSESVNKRQDHL
jgi:hypothetical protein